jgi:hypothetical protein
MASSRYWRGRRKAMPLLIILTGNANDAVAFTNNVRQAKRDTEFEHCTPDGILWALWQAENNARYGVDTTIIYLQDHDEHTLRLIEKWDKHVIEFHHFTREYNGSYNDNAWQNAWS